MCKIFETFSNFCPLCVQSVPKKVTEFQVKIILEISGLKNSLYIFENLEHVVTSMGKNH